MTNLFAVRVGQAAAWHVGDGERPFRYQATLISFGAGARPIFRIQNYLRAEVDPTGRVGRAVIAAVTACEGRDPRDRSR